MRAAIVKKKGTNPVLGRFEAPVATEGHVIVKVTAAALSRVSKYRSLGLHYSSGSHYPVVAGMDGAGMLEDGTRVYFAMPAGPYGSLAEQTMVHEKLIVRLPERIDDVTAAAIANPAMSAWAALIYRAGFQSGQSVLINGATGASGSMAVQIARGLGAGKIMVTGRNEAKLQALGADQAIAFDMTAEGGQTALEHALTPVLSEGVDVVLDYLWGASAITVMSALAKSHSERVTRFVSIGTASGEEEVSLSSSLLRASKLELVGSGGKSVSKADMLTAVKGVFELAAKHHLTIPTMTYALEDLDAAWRAPLTPRPVIKL